MDPNQDTIQSQQTVAQPTKQSSPYTNNFLKIFTIVVLMIFIGVGGYMLGARSVKPSQSISLPQKQTTPIPTFTQPSPIPSITQTINSFNQQCQTDSDCVVIDKNSNLSDPCTTACVNYSSSSAIAVNNTWLMQHWSGQTCHTGFMCTFQVLQSQKTHTVQCANSLCQLK